jgi:hypothetical protein
MQCTVFQNGCLRGNTKCGVPLLLLLLRLLSLLSLLALRCAGRGVLVEGIEGIEGLALEPSASGLPSFQLLIRLGPSHEPPRSLHLKTLSSRCAAITPTLAKGRRSPSRSLSTITLAPLLNTHVQAPLVMLHSQRPRPVCETHPRQKKLAARRVSRPRHDITSSTVTIHRPARCVRHLTMPSVSHRAFFFSLLSVQCLFPVLKQTELLFTPVDTTCTIPTQCLPPRQNVRIARLYSSAANSGASSLSDLQGPASLRVRHRKLAGPATPT